VQRDASLPYEIRLEAQKFLAAIVNREENIRTAHPELAEPAEDMEFGLTTYNPHRGAVRDMVESISPKMINGKDRSHL
jgi:hypothetical protein